MSLGFYFSSGFVRGRMATVRSLLVFQPKHILLWLLISLTKSTAVNCGGLFIHKSWLLITWIKAGFFFPQRVKTDCPCSTHAVVPYILIFLDQKYSHEHNLSTKHISSKGRMTHIWWEFWIYLSYVILGLNVHPIFLLSLVILVLI